MDDLLGAIAGFVGKVAERLSNDGAETILAVSIITGGFCFCFYHVVKAFVQDRQYEREYDLQKSKLDNRINHRRNKNSKSARKPRKNRGG